jgi:hypothetical protein
MQFKKILVIVSVALFATISCIKLDKSIGENLIPSGEDLEIKVAEIEIPVRLKLADSLQSVASDYANIGAINTKELGLVEFSAAANIAPISKGLRFGKDPQIKEIWFSGIVSKQVMLNDNQEGIPQNIYVHKLNKTLDTTQVYNNSLTGDFYNKTPLNTIETTYFGGDTIKVLLNNSLGSDILSATETELDSIDLFTKRFGGLVVRSSAPETGLFGGRINMVSFSSATIYIKYNFQPTWDSDLSRKDTVVQLGFGSSYCLNLSTYNSNKLQTTQATSSLSIEGVAGIKPYISYKDIKETLNAWLKNNGYNNKNIALSKASVVLPFEFPADYDMTTYPQMFTFARRYNNSNINMPYYYACTDLTAYSRIGKLNRSLKEYEVDIPETIQEIIEKPESELDNTYNLWFFPISSIEDSMGNISYILNTSEYFVGNINGNLADRKPKLKIAYTVFDK